jgi:hypothetical protein
MTRRKRKTRGSTLPGGILVLALAVGVIPLAACGGGSGEAEPEQETTGTEAEEMTLGPEDGFDLPATDLERVAVGSAAPDFSLQTLGGETVTLSSFRGAKNVVLVFYRGHW